MPFKNIILIISDATNTFWDYLNKADKAISKKFKPSIIFNLFENV